MLKQHLNRHFASTNFSNMARFFSQLTPNEPLSNFLKNNQPIIIDVREPDEYISGHIPNAILMPHQQAKENIEEDYPNRETPLALYCKSGARSRYVMLELISDGYTKVADLGSIKKAQKALTEAGQIKSDEKEHL